MTGGSSAPAFTHAVASFDPTPTSVLLWTRVAGGASAVEWVVARDGALRDVVGSGSASVRADADHTVVVDADGLDPGTTWFYAFTAEGVRSPVGRTRTLPAPGSVEPVRLGLTCCALYAEAPFAVYRLLAGREVDLVLHLGDAIYEAGPSRGPRAPDPPHPTRTLADYRRRHACHRSDPDALALHLRHPVLAVWDDHDVCDNAAVDGSHAHDPAVDGAWRDRVAAALRARVRVDAEPDRRAALPPARHVADGRPRRRGRAGPARHPLRRPRPPSR